MGSSVSTAETSTQAVASNMVIHPHLRLHLVFVVHGVLVKVPILVLLIVRWALPPGGLRARDATMLVFECSLLCSTSIELEAEP